jgi:glucose dehydrogenase
LPTIRPSGAFLAYDLARGRIAWRVSLPPSSLAFGGSSVTSGNVIIHGESAGFVDARDSTSGKLLWRYRTNAGADAAPAIYSVGGITYIAIAAGGIEVIGSARGDTLYVIALR